MITYDVHIVGNEAASEQSIFKRQGSSHTRIAVERKIEWRIQRNSGIDFIEAIKEKRPAQKIESNKTGPQGNYYDRVIRTTASESVLYVYYIKWQMCKNVRTYGPLISIRQCRLHHIVDIILKFPLGLIVGMMAGCLYWRKKKMELQAENKILRRESERLKLNQK